jgi:hypothetical protein
MAWVTEYDLKWLDHLSGRYGGIYLQRDEGTYQQSLLLRTGSLEVRNVLPDWEQQIVRANCSFTVVNNLDDFFELMPLMTISNGQIKVVVTDETDSAVVTFFEGFLNCEIIEQDMIHNSDLRFTASGLLSKLNDNYPISIDTLQNMSLIDVIDDCLLLTGASYDIRVDCSLYELNSALAAGQTLFNRTALFTELLWKNNVDRYTGLEILKSILKSFHCFLYWKEQYWYIQHYQDMGNTQNSPYQKSYVQYTSGTSAGYQDADSGSVEVVTVGEPYDIHAPGTRPQIGGTQVLSVIPGLREIEVRKEQKQYFNLINKDLTDSTDNSDILPLPPIREWLRCVTTGIFGWLAGGLPWKNISNSVQRTGYGVSTLNNYANGLSTAFNMTIKDDTALTIRWKYGVLSKNYIPGGFTDNWDDYTIDHHWWMYVIIGMSTYYVMYHESAGTWYYNISTPSGALQTIQKSGDDFDKELLTMDLSVTIPIGEIFALSSGADQDARVTFGIGHEQYDDGVISPVPSAFSFFGDVEASISETPDENVIRGSQNTDFLDKKTITLDLFDSGWSYRNILKRGNNYQYRATEWGYDSVSDELSRWLLATKFRLYNVARQRIKVRYRSTELFAPLGLWKDNKQSDKLFVLFADFHYPEKGEHLVELYEYDDSTEINLIDT